MRTEVEQRERHADEAEKRARWRLRVALAAALTLGAAAVLISIYAATGSAERVAERIAPQVSADQITDARQTRAENARRLLAAANAELDRRDLPVVTDPGPAAGADQLQAAATTAQVLALLPPETTEELQGDPALVVLLSPDGTVNTVPPGPEEEPTDGG